MIDDVAKAREAHALIKAGAIDGLSIGFYTKTWSYDKDADVLELLELDLREISVVTFPANADSTVDNVKADLIQQSDTRQAINILKNISL